MALTITIVKIKTFYSTVLGGKQWESKRLMAGESFLKIQICTKIFQRFAHNFMFILIWIWECVLSDSLPCEMGQVSHIKGSCPWGASAALRDDGAGMCRERGCDFRKCLIFDRQLLRWRMAQVDKLQVIREPSLWAQVPEPIHIIFSLLNNSVNDKSYFWPH